jgi:pentose-5-phosphate-3-epimerase
MFNDAGKNIDIMVDGQVKDSTAPKLVEAGANVLVLGTSGLFNKYKPEEYGQAIKWYQNL